MKKKSINLSKKLTLNKETITELNNKLQEQVFGGKTITATVQLCPPVSGTGCGCAMQTCGIVLCSAAPVCNGPADPGMDM